MQGVDADDDTLDLLPIGAGGGARARPDRASGDGGRRPSRWWVFAVVAILGTGIAVALLWPSDDTGEDDTADPDRLEAGDAADFDDLIDGQLISLVVEDVLASVDTVTVQCVPTGEADTACDPTSAHHATTSPSGRLEAEAQVWRVISTPDHGSYDCARQPCELRTYGGVPGAPTHAKASLGFDPRNTASLPPEIYAVEAVPTAEETITLRSNGLAEGTDVHLTGCRVGSDIDPVACDVLWDLDVAVGATGLHHEIDADTWHGVFATRCDAGCRIDFAIAGLDRQPFSIHLPPSDRTGLLRPTEPTIVPLDLVVSPATGLLDGQEVTIEGSGLTNQMALYLCADAVTFDCTWLGTAVTADVQTVRLPRAFVSWRGGLRDCAVAACVVSVLGPMDLEDQSTAAVSFDSTVPLEPGRPVSIDHEGPVADGQTVALSVDPNESAMEWPNMSVCARDRTETCEYLNPDVSNDAVRVTLFRTLNTPTGPHDCIDDGPCDLNVWIDGRAERFEPLALEFDPDAPRSREAATLTVRPGGPLSDGDAIALTIRSLESYELVVFASICVTGETRCAFLGSIDANGHGSSISADFRIRRVVTMQSSVAPGPGTPVDCLEVECEIRLSNVWAGTPAPLTFKDEPPLPDPEVALDVSGPIPTDELIGIRGRRFTFISLSEHQELWLDVQLCRAGDEPDSYSGCYSIGAVAGTNVDLEAGTFSGSIVVPDRAPEFTRRPDGDVCDVECVLVVFDGAGPPGIVPVTIDR